MIVEQSYAIKWSISIGIMETKYLMKRPRAAASQTESDSDKLKNKYFYLQGR